MQKVLLLGATGFIGSNIARELNHRGRNWVGVSRSTVYGENSSKFITLADDNKLLNELEKKPIVISAMGGLKPRDYEADFAAAMAEFWRATHKILGLLRKRPPGLLMQISSAGTIYGDASHKPSIETDPPAPCSWYGRMKVVEEALFQQFAFENGVPFICARVSNPFGNINHPTHGLIDVLIDHIRRGEMFKACFPEGARRDFIHAPEMARILVEMVDNPVPGTYNVARGESVSLASLVQYVRESVPQALIQNVESVATDVKVSALSVEKLRGCYGITPQGPNAFEYIRDSLPKVNV